MQLASLIIGFVGLVSSAAAIYNCSTFAPDPISTSDLAEQFIPGVASDIVSIESIRSTLVLYALALDGRNWNALDKVFTAEARANYSDPLGVLEGLDSIKSYVSNALDVFSSTQHQLGTPIIDVCGNSAASITYFTAAHFETADLGPTVVSDSTVMYAHAMYQDTWARQKDGTWKINNRNLVYMGGLVTDERP